MRRGLALMAAVGLLTVGTAPAARAQMTAASPTPAPTATPGPPQIAFPGQYALAPSDWHYPVWSSTCLARYEGAERAACLDFVVEDYARLARFAAANAALAKKAPGESRVVFFGDSITDNWNKFGYGGFFPGKPYVNRGIGGQTTSQMLVRFRADVLNLDPDVVVILAGTNDVAGNTGPIAPEAIEGNLASMAELARAHGVRVVMASILPVADDKRDTAGQPAIRTKDRPPATLRAINTWMADYAGKNGAIYLDYASAVSDAGGAFRADLNGDGLHPNAAGYAVMAPLAEKAIAEALKEKAITETLTKKR